MPQYLYSTVEEPFPHRIRCVPNPETSHEDGAEWLNALYETLDVWGMTEGVDYRVAALTMFDFASLDQAETIYTSLLLGIGGTLRQFDEG